MKQHMNLYIYFCNSNQFQPTLLWLKNTPIASLLRSKTLSTPNECPRYDI